MNISLNEYDLSNCIENYICIFIGYMWLDHMAQSANRNAPCRSAQLDSGSTHFNVVSYFPVCLKSLQKSTN